MIYLPWICGALSFILMAPALLSILINYGIKNVLLCPFAVAVCFLFVWYSPLKYSQTKVFRTLAEEWNDAKRVVGIK